MILPRRRWLCEVRSPCDRRRIASPPLPITASRAGDPRDNKKRLISLDITAFCGVVYIIYKVWGGYLAEDSVSGVSNGSSWAVVSSIGRI